MLIYSGVCIEPEMLFDNYINVYPTVAKDFINIEVKTFEINHLLATVTDVLGKTIWKNPIDLSGPFILDIKDFTFGP